MRLRRLFIAVVLASSTANAFACIPAPPDPVGEAEGAELVFVGHVVEKRGHALVIATMENLKGTARASVAISLDLDDGHAPAVLACGSMPVAPGEDALVFHQGRYWWLRPVGGAFESTLRAALTR